MPNQPTTIVTRLRTALLCACLALLVGCASYPLGMNKEQWESLSPEEQIAAREKQDAINAERRAREEAERLERERIAEAKRIEQQRIVEERRRHARYGDIITVIVEEGVVEFSGKHRPYQPVAFDLVRGETRSVTFHRSDNRTSMDALMVLSDDGRTLTFDAGCRKPLRFIDKKWRDGETYAIKRHENTNLNPMNMKITVRYTPIGGLPRQPAPRPTPREPQPRPQPPSTLPKL